MTYRTLLLSLLLLPASVTPIAAQSLFETAVTSDEGTVAYELNGYVRGAVFAGKIPDKNEYDIKSDYAEAALKLRVRKTHLGDCYAELRIRSGYDYDRRISELTLREAYVDAYAGPFDFRLGKQIVVWGRADGINPTNNVTPINMIVHSCDEDDRREANFLLRFHLNLPPLRSEWIWVPVYKASTIPVSLFPLPSNVEMGESDFPEPRIENGSAALRLNLETAAVDGSLSYFFGYNSFPGLEGSATFIPPDSAHIVLSQKPYRMHVLGADFATTAGSLCGVRGEIAYTRSEMNHEEHVHVPNPEIELVLGVDREIGDFDTILQYAGKYVLDFEEPAEPVNPFLLPDYEFELTNRLISSQQDEHSHSVFLRSALDLLHETLTLEISGSYNFTTEEILVRPKASYDIADDFVLTAGGALYTGPEESLFGMIDDSLSAVYVELRVSF